MKFYLRSYDKEEMFEKEVSSLNAALTDKKEGEKLHICRHDEGLPCSIV